MLQTADARRGGEGHSKSAFPIVSVITPFYNSADTLERCINSVLSQSHRDFEYILADNSSTDGSSEIARAFASADTRIRYVYFDEHLPEQLPNYNRALLLMSPAAQYCKIVQADDFIYETCLEKMLRLALRNKRIGVVGAIYMNGNELNPVNANKLTEVSRGTEVCQATLRSEFFAFGSQTSVMYRADLVRARPEFFNVKAQFADTDVAFDLLRQNDFGFCRELLTHTTRDPNSKFGQVASYDIELLYNYMTVHRIGRYYFTSSELADLKRRLSLAYYERLVQALWRRADRADYLRFHRSALRSNAGMDLNPVKAAAAFVRRVLSVLRRRLGTWFANRPT